jgi:hypothetical protein
MPTIKFAGVVENVLNRATPAQAVTAATEAVVSGSQIVLTKPLAVGDIFQWRVSMTKTAAGTGNSAFKVKTNTSTTVAVGTSGGAATAATLTFPVAETAVAGSALVYIEAVVRAVDAAAGIVDADLTAISSTAPATGFSNQQTAAVGTGLDTSGAIASVGLSITTGAADVVTINYAEGRLLPA